MGTHHFQHEQTLPTPPTLLLPPRTRMAFSTVTPVGIPCLAKLPVSLKRTPRTSASRVPAPKRSSTVRASAETQPPAAETSKSFGDLMGFGGVAPELINGRLSMVAFLAAAGAELSTHETVVQQLSEAPLAVGGFVALISLASFMPQLRGDDMDPSNGWEALKKSPFTSPSSIEKWNGRAAMLGVAALLVLERGGSSFF